MDSRGVPEYALREWRDCLHHMLAAVEDEQRAAVLQECHDARCRVFSQRGEAERGGDTGRYLVCAAQRSQVDEAHVASEVGDPSVRDGYGDGCLAHASR